MRFFNRNYLDLSKILTKFAAKLEIKMKETKHRTGGTILTLGLDIDQKHTITLQEVDDVWCVCLHKHRE